MKNSILKNDEKCLLQLFRISLGREQESVLPENLNWDNIVRLSARHNVSVLASDALVKIGLPVPHEWEKDRQTIEYSFAYYKTVIQTLTQIFKERGLSPIVLKGLPLSDNYPIPSHRGAGDIDIFVIDKDGHHVPELADEVLREYSEVGGEPTHHTHANFKGITIENHYNFSELYIYKANGPETEKTLKHLLFLESYEDKYGILSPSATFNALFLMIHMFKHTYGEYFRLRQLIDWMLFLEKHFNEIDWNLVEKIWGKCEMTEFVKYLHCFLIRRLGMNPDVCKIYYNEEQKARTMDYEVFPKSLAGKNLLSKFYLYSVNQWKLRLFGRKTLVKIILEIFYILYVWIKSPNRRYWKLIKQCRK